MFVYEMGKALNQAAIITIIWMDSMAKRAERDRSLQSVLGLRRRPVSIQRTDCPIRNSAQIFANDGFKAMHFSTMGLFLSIS